MSTFEFWLLRSGASWTVVPGLTVTWLVVYQRTLEKHLGVQTWPNGRRDTPSCWTDMYINIELNLKKRKVEEVKKNPTKQTRPHVRLLFQLSLNVKVGNR